MRGLFCLAAFTVCLATGTVLAQDRALLAGGKEWKVVKSEEAPPGTKLVFGNDGKLTLILPVDGKPREIPGTFTLAGDQLTLKFSQDGRERVETRTIKKLTDTVLITADRTGKIEELQR